MIPLAVPKSSEEWEYKFIPQLTSGLNLSEKPEDLKDSQLTVAKNIRFEQNRIYIDTGYQTFGSTVRGNVRATFQFFKKTGDAYLLGITNATVYLWDESSQQWQYASSATATTLNGGEAASATSLTVHDITGFADGDFIGIILSDGTQHQTTVDGTPAGGEIVITDPLPSDASDSAAVVKAVVLNGSPSIPVSITVFPAVDYMIFTNGSDTPQKFDGATCEDLAGLPGGTFTARVVALFKDHLLFLHTVEGGTAHPQRVRRSDTGDPEEWVAGNAGFTDLFGSEDWITAASPLGPYLIIYKERSIVRAEYVGLESELIAYSDVVIGEGARSEDAIVNLGDEHIFFGSANIYRYQGGYRITPVGDPIYHRVFSSQGDLNPSEQSNVHGMYIEESDEVWFFYPHGSNSSPKRMIRILLSNYAFSEREFLSGVTGYGFYVLQESKSWADLEGDWAAQIWEWGAKTSLANAPVTHLCLGNQVVEYNYLESTDDGEQIEYQIDTKDFYIPNYFMRFDRLAFSGRGLGINVYYSTDEGLSWNLLKIVSPGSQFTRVRIWKQFVARTVRFRFQGTGGNFALEWLAFEYSIESES